MTEIGDRTTPNQAGWRVRMGYDRRTLLSLRFAGHSQRRSAHPANVNAYDLNRGISEGHADTLTVDTLDFQKRLFVNRRNLGAIVIFTALCASLTQTALVESSTALHSPRVGWRTILTIRKSDWPTSLVNISTLGFQLSAIRQRSQMAQSAKVTIALFDSHFDSQNQQTKKNPCKSWVFW